MDPTSISNGLDAKTVVQKIFKVDHAFRDLVSEYLSAQSSDRLSWAGR
jgi:N12 class adenine-specific DNA methylase